MTPASERWTPSGIVTLLTDFGVRDPYVGIMKGVLYRDAPSLRAVVDLTHDVPPQRIELAAFHLAHAWRWFPVGTVHVTVVDPGVGTAREILVIEVGGHVVLAPDNGVAGRLLVGEEGARVRRLALDRIALDRLALDPPSATFHGRDVFAPVAARLVEGRAPAELGEECDSFETGTISRARRRSDGTIEARVLFADHFGNLVTDADASLLGGSARGWCAEMGGSRARGVGTYGEAEPGEAVLLVDSFGMAEIAVRDGDAAHTLGGGPGSGVRLLREETA